MDFALLFGYVLSILLLIITPGPVMALVVSVASKHKKTILLTILGTNTASLIYLIIASLSILGILKINNDLLTILSFLGCLFIGFLAIQIITGYFKAQKITDKNDSPSKLKGGFLVGFLVAIANPKDIIFFISFFPQFILITDSFFSSILVLSIVWIVVDFLVLYFCSYLMKKQSVKIKQLIELFSGLLLLTIALISFAFNIYNL